MVDNSNKIVTSKKDVPVLCSQRWILAYVGFFGIALVSAMRGNFSLAIVCMVEPSNATNVYQNISTRNCAALSQTETTSNYQPEFEWDKRTQSVALACFFYGYICTQVLGGWLSDRIGGRRVFGIAMSISSLCTLFTPLCARTSVIAVYAIRVALGMASGVTFPSLQSVLGRWAPRYERSSLFTLSFTGSVVGTVVSFTSSGYLCEHGFDNGWASIFYLTGGATAIWVVIWFLLVRDTPADHPWITQRELKYISENTDFDTSKRPTSIPWTEIIQSPPVIACMIGHFGYNWTYYTISTSIPTYMRTVLKFDIKSNGALSSLPFASKAISGFVLSRIADYILKKKYLTAACTRRLLSTLGFLGSIAFILGTGFISCDHRTISVAFLSLTIMFSGFHMAGYALSHVDFGSNFAGFIYGLMNTCGTVSGMAAPIVGGMLTPNDTAAEWRNVFYVCSAVSVFAMVVFACFVRGETQIWAMEPKEITIDIPQINHDKPV